MFSISKQRENMATDTVHALFTDISDHESTTVWI